MEVGTKHFPQLSMYCNLHYTGYKAPIWNENHWTPFSLKSMENLLHLAYSFSNSLLTITRLTNSQRKLYFLKFVRVPYITNSESTIINKPAERKMNVFYGESCSNWNLWNNTALAKRSFIYCSQFPRGCSHGYWN